MASAGALRWLERVGGVALGSLVTAWWMREEPVPPVVESLADAAPTRARAPIDPPAVTARDAAPASPIAAPSPIVAPAPAPAPVPVTVQPSEGAAAPSLPLPRMPGAARLSDAARLDTATSTWVLRASYRVHAHVPQVLAFYTKALSDEGLAVTHGQDPEQPDGTTTVYLYGRSDRVRAQVSVRTKGRDLDARIGLLWRVRQ